MAARSHARRTAHSAQDTAHYDQSRPVWGGGADGGDGGTGGKAANEDRVQRAAWPSVVMRSPYLHLVDLPDAVMAGDRAHAQRIADRVQECLDMEGKWTHAERARLRGMRDAWMRRASGRDMVFNVLGWEHKQGAKRKEMWMVMDEWQKLEKVLEDLNNGW